MKKIDVGASVARLIVVDNPRTVDFLGDGLRVYATPELVRDIEATCRDFLLGFVDAGEDSVGFGINVPHSGATPLGMQVDIAITVTAVEGRKVRFEVTAKDDVEEICKGHHDRFVIEVDKLRARVAAKAAKLKSI